MDRLGFEPRTFIWKYQIDALRLRHRPNHYQAAINRLIEARIIKFVDNFDNIVVLAFDLIHRL